MSTGRSVRLKPEERTSACGGAQTDLLTLAKEVAELKRVHAVGGDEPTLRDKPRWQVNSELPSTELRPGAEKQMLRPWEEEALPLVRRSLHRSFQRPPA